MIDEPEPVRRQAEILARRAAVADADAARLVIRDMRLVFLFGPIDIADRGNTVAHDVMQVRLDMVGLQG